MPQDTLPRDYTLTGKNRHTGFDLADWYTTPVDRKRLKTLMKRDDQTALINYAIWLGSIILLGSLLVITWGSWWAVPVAILYGVFYGSGGDSRWHETGHGTVFKTRWLNDVFYQLASFMSLRNPHVWRWSHTRHHSETVVVGRDPEIAFPRPPSLWQWALNLIYVPTLVGELQKMVRISFGSLTEAEKSYTPEIDRGKAVWASRAQLAILLATVGLSLSLQSWLPLMLIGLPTFYGSWLHHLMATTQHAGLAEDLPDHRLNSRTVLMNPFFRFIYSNMNYHVEHHMFPNVPFYALPALHDEIKHDCPPPYPSLWAAYREIIPTVIRQQKDYGHFAARPLPEGAGPTPDTQRHPMPMAAE
ncbi:fatty acid desaturase [Aliiroseovarius crassostreae]|uniref:fatty acid desaturase n=1 Tax=Aliiroseovarius crassostreae TaxID=154981 RepID=UPI003C7CD897